MTKFPLGNIKNIFSNSIISNSRFLSITQSRIESCIYVETAVHIRPHFPYPSQLFIFHLTGLCAVDSLQGT